jgi:glycosyltransferase involved in cell wall biosynthesis
VIIPTWGRHNMLFKRCLPSVARQTYTGLVEVCLVSDGKDWALEDLAAAYSSSAFSLRYDNVPGTLNHQPRWGNEARTLALEMASGDYIAYLDDDDAYRPRHIEVLVKALQEHPEAGFAYSKMASWGAHIDPPGGAIVGGSLAPTQIGTPMIMHRCELEPWWGPPDPMEDWRMVEKWVKDGVTSVHVDEVTIDVWPQAYRGFGEDEV